jgi:twitching motility two-component system response regulator PilH
MGILDVIKRWFGGKSAPVKPTSPTRNYSPAPTSPPPTPAPPPALSAAEALDVIAANRAAAKPTGFVERREKTRVNARDGTRVLVIDDSPTIVALLKRMLEQNGYKALEAMDAETGVTMATSDAPDLIFLDIVLPGMNGFEALRRLRRDPATKTVPIVMISGNELATEQFYAQRIGADDFMKKPFSRSEVFARIERLLDAEKVPRRHLAVVKPLPVADGASGAGVAPVVAVPVAESVVANAAPAATPAAVVAPVVAVPAIVVAAPPAAPTPTPAPIVAMPAAVVAVPLPAVAAAPAVAPVATPAPALAPLASAPVAAVPAPLTVEVAIEVPEAILAAIPVADPVAALLATNPESVGVAHAAPAVDPSATAARAAATEAMPDPAISELVEQATQTVVDAATDEVAEGPGADVPTTAQAAPAAGAAVETTQTPPPPATIQDPVDAVSESSRPAAPDPSQTLFIEETLQAPANDDLQPSASMPAAAVAGAASAAFVASADSVVAHEPNAVASSPAPMAVAASMSSPQTSSQSQQVAST